MSNEADDWRPRGIADQGEVEYRQGKRPEAVSEEEASDVQRRSTKSW